MALATALIERGFSDESRYWVSADRFRLQLDIIRKLGLRIAMLDELLGDSVEISVPAVAITFDDGLASTTLPHCVCFRKQGLLLISLSIPRMSVSQATWIGHRFGNCIAPECKSVLMVTNMSIIHNRGCSAGSADDSLASDYRKELQHPIKWFRLHMVWSVTIFSLRRNFRASRGYVRRLVL